MRTITDLNDFNLPMKSDFAVTTNGHVHVHSLQFAPRNDERFKERDSRPMPAPLEVHFNGANLNESIPVYDAFELEDATGGEIIRGFTHDEVRKHKYVIYVTDRGKVMKFSTRTFLAHRQCFYSCAVFDDRVGYACLANEGDDILLINNLGHAVVFSVDLIPIYDIDNKPEGFDSYMTNTKSIFSRLMAASLVEDGEFVIFFEHGYLSSIDLDDVYRVTSRDGFIRNLWKDENTKLLPKSKKFGAPYAGGYFRSGDFVLIYTEDDRALPLTLISEDGHIFRPEEFFSINEFLGVNLFSKSNKINDAQRFTKEEWFAYLKEIEERRSDTP